MALVGGARDEVRPSLGGAGGAVHKTRLQGRARRGEDRYGAGFPSWDTGRWRVRAHP